MGLPFVIGSQLTGRLFAANTPWLPRLFRLTVTFLKSALIVELSDHLLDWSDHVRERLVVQALRDHGVKAAVDPWTARTRRKVQVTSDLMLIAFGIRVDLMAGGNLLEMPLFLHHFFIVLFDLIPQVEVISGLGFASV